LPSRDKFRKDPPNEVCIFPSGCSRWQIDPLYQPLHHWLIVARYHAAIQQFLRKHLDVTSELVSGRLACGITFGPMCFFSWLLWKTGWIAQLFGSSNL
jgi:hypothetical protein